MIRVTVVRDGGDVSIADWPDFYGALMATEQWADADEMIKIVWEWFDDDAV
jgi:hypothetical protein